MALELLKPDGRAVSGLPCIYHTQLGTFFSEAVAEDGDSLIFDPERTVALFIQPPQPNGSQQIAHMKGFGPNVPFRPSTMRVGKAGVIVTDCTDPKIIGLWRSALSGIVLASGLPPGPSDREVN